MKMLTLPAGTQHVRFDELAHLMAYALWPLIGDDSPGDGLNYGFALIDLERELVQAVESKDLPVKNPLTFGQYTRHVSGVNLADALVRVDDFRTYAADRGILVAVDAPESESVTAQTNSTGQRHSKMQSMLKRLVSAEQTTADIEIENVERRLREANQHQERCQETLENAPGTGDIQKLQDAEQAVHLAGIATADAEAAHKLLRGDRPGETQQPAPAQDTAMPAPLETVEQRRARYLAWHTEESRINQRGAVQRVFERELLRNSKADRSAIGKDIRKARGTIKTQTSVGAMYGQLVKDGKRQ